MSGQRCGKKDEARSPGKLKKLLRETKPEGQGGRNVLVVLKQERRAVEINKGA